MHIFFIILSLITFSSCSSLLKEIEKLPDPPVVEIPATEFSHCLRGFTEGFHVNSRTGVKTKWNKRGPTDNFLTPLFNFVHSQCDSNDAIFGSNNHPLDSFSHLRTELGISSASTRKYRCAALFELIRTSGAFESDYNWKEGRDVSASNYDLYTQEAGLFQTSPNSHYDSVSGTWHKYLNELVAKHGVGQVRKGSPENAKWNALMKNMEKKSVIIEHYAFMLRHNYKHYGPVIDKVNRVGVNLNRSCIKEVEGML